MKLRGIPVLQPGPLFTDPCGPIAAAQPILQFKELQADMVRWEAWKQSLRAPHPRSRKRK